jgi:hypothetical protein
MRLIIYVTDENTAEQIKEVLEDADQNELFDGVFTVQQLEDDDFLRRFSDE